MEGAMIHTGGSQALFCRPALPHWPPMPHAILTHCLLQVHRETLFKSGQVPG